jgi:hypothetical protein
MNSRPEYTPLSAVLPRLYWMVFGNIFLVLTALTTALGSFQNLLVASLLFWVNVICMAVIRYLDIRFFRGETVDSTVATLSHWKKYSVSLFVVSALVWSFVLLFRTMLIGGCDGPHAGSAIQIVEIL